MFSEKPIIVYSSPITGIASYASEEQWAIVVDRRDPDVLATILEKLFKDKEERQRIIDNAKRVALQNHHLPAIQSRFYELIYGCKKQNCK